MKIWFNLALGLVIAFALTGLAQLWFDLLSSATFLRVQITLASLCGLAALVGYVIRERSAARQMVRRNLE